MGESGEHHCLPVSPSCRYTWDQVLDSDMGECVHDNIYQKSVAFAYCNVSVIWSLILIFLNILL